MIQVQIDQPFVVTPTSRVSGESEPTRIAWRGASQDPRLQRAETLPDGTEGWFTVLNNDGEPIRMSRSRGVGFFPVATGKYRIRGGSADLIMVGPSAAIVE